MAQLANCPHCDHELLVPGEISADSRLRCPKCHAFFQLNEASSRAIEVVDVPETASDEPSDEIYTKQTVADLSSMATWDGEIDEPSDTKTTVPFEPTSLHIAESNESDATDSSDPKAFDDFVSAMEADTIAADFESSEIPDEEGSSADEKSPHAAELHVADLEDEFVDSDATEGESPEAAAQRIDAWFRSAKTLADVPRVHDDAAEPSTESTTTQDLDFMPAASRPTADELDFQDTDKPDLQDNFDLDFPAEPEQDVAAWDDSQHIDRLLAEVQDQPPDEYVPSAAETAPEEVAELEPSATPDTEWTPDESYSMTAGGRDPGRKKSLLRTMVMAAVGGLMGLGLGYYVLLWLGIDLLGAAHYLPQAMRPAAFKSSPKVASAPLAPVSSTEETEQPASDSAAAPAAEETQQAATSTSDPAVEPATFNEPNAAPVKPAEATPIQISGAPSFTAAQLSAALQAGTEAEPNLVNGNLSDSQEIARRKGFSYSILADLAQKLTFTNLDASTDDAKIQQEVEALFRKTLADHHARDEIAQIVPKWIASPNRKQGGVFFAGTIQNNQLLGTVAECTVEFGSHSLPVLLPASAAEQLKGSAGPVAIVGWIVDDPAKNVPGYTGTAPQAVFANRLVSLN